MTKSVILFGKHIDVKTRGCDHVGFKGEPIPPSVNIFIKATNGCNAHCAFCSNAGADATSRFDMDKLFSIIDEVKKSGLFINRINITGGEPSVVSERIYEMLFRLSDTGYNDVHVHLNTNGLLPSSQKLMRHSRWDSISVSLHHYLPEKLSEIYNTKISSDALNFEGVDMMKVNASCNLIRGYIDSTNEAKKMMDFCLDKGFTRLGFVGLMPVNGYCKEHMVSLKELKLDRIPHCYFTETKSRGDDCCCSNYLYNRDLKILDIYMRHYTNPSYCESSLLYDGTCLRQGFHSNNIII